MLQCLCVYIYLILSIFISIHFPFFIHHIDEKGCSVACESNCIVTCNVWVHYRIRNCISSPHFSFLIFISCHAYHFNVNIVCNALGEVWQRFITKIENKVFHIRMWIGIENKSQASAMSTEKFTKLFSNFI